MFDKPYYEDKGKKLTTKLYSKRLEVIQTMWNVLNAYIGEEKEIVAELQEIDKVLAEGKVVEDKGTTNNESQSGETNTVPDGGEEVSKDGEGEVRPDKSDSPKKTK
jgi:hypothetical protein